MGEPANDTFDFFEVGGYVFFACADVDIAEGAESQSLSDALQRLRDSLGKKAELLLAAVKASTEPRKERHMTLITSGKSSIDSLNNPDVLEDGTGKIS